MLLFHSMTAPSTRGYALPVFPYRAPPELAPGARAGHYPVVIVGGGLAGLTIACDLAARGVAALLLDEDDTIGVRGASSRGICYAQKSLEIYARLGIYERIREKGVTWSIGRTLIDDEEIFSFDLAASNISLQPPFINIQQFYVEWFLVDRINALGLTDLRWKNRVAAVEQGDGRARLSVDTPDGAYRITADWVVDATGVNSGIRESLKLQSIEGRGADRWCIVDVRFAAPLPQERRAWLRASFNDGRAAWQHPMADDVWRMDYELEPGIDPEIAGRADVAEERLRAHLGADSEFELIWVGPWRYRTHLLERFRQGRVLFIGDSAHSMSPLGARGGNSGIQDAENLAWKLALLVTGKARAGLLDSYHLERHAAAVENLKASGRSARFLSPKSDAERVLRSAVLGLARDCPFARSLIDTGRMSTPMAYPGSTAVIDAGTPVPNVPLDLPGGGRGGLCDLLVGRGCAFLGIWFDPPQGAGACRDALLAAAADGAVPLLLFGCGGGALPRVGDAQGLLRQALNAAAGELVVIRPDMVLAARLQQPDRAAIDAAMARLLSADREAITQ